MTTCCGCAKATMVVEYLELSMSRKLLCKFPENSSFDFDYSQSSIWSPLVPPPFPPLHINNCSVLRGTGKSSSVYRKLSYEEVEGLLNRNTIILQEVMVNIKKKITSTVLNNLQNYHKMKVKKKNYDFSENHPSVKRNSTTHTPRKGWAKVLKAASKQFKKTSKKKDPTSNIKLSNSWAVGNF